MRFLLLISFVFFSIATFAQARAQHETFESLLSKGKAEFKKPHDEQDFTSAVTYLRKAVTLQPENAEAHYFLGYAYSRLNAKDGKSMIKMDLQWTKRSSEEFEQVIQLTRKYTGEMVVLDPYSKLTAEWGSMAMCYWNNNKLDSAVWAFNEGKRRGGFGAFYLAINKSMLSQCSKNAILVCSGDNLTIPLWYLQIIEGYRKDIAVINIDLLNTTWYPQQLRSKSTVAFDQPQASIDTLEYVYFKDSVVSVRNKYAYKDFSWTIRKTAEKDYLLRSDRLFLSILKANEFESDVYFTTRFDKESRLSLDDYLIPMILLDQLNVAGKEKYSFATYKAKLTEVLELTKKVNLNSSDEINFVDNLRYDLLIHLEEQNERKHKSEAKQLLKLLDTYLPESKFPYGSKETKAYVNYLRKRL